MWLHRKFHPYIHIHELVGDAVILVANLESHCQQLNIAALVVAFLSELSERTPFVETRIGVAMDRLHVGYIDDRLQLFGSAINLAARLEGVCPPRHAMVDATFLAALKVAALLPSSPPPSPSLLSATETPPISAWAPTLASAALSGALDACISETHELKGFGRVASTLLPLGVVPR